MSKPCNTCGQTFDWGWDEESSRWIPLEPTATHNDLPRTFVDENGELRADHRDRHSARPTVNVTRLKKKIPAETANQHGDALVKSEPKRRGRRALNG